MTRPYLQSSHLLLYNNSSTSVWGLSKHSGVTTVPMKRKKSHKTSSFTEWLFDLDAPANVFRLTQSVPLASVLWGAAGSPTVWCNGQGSGLLLRRQHRHRVYCPRWWLGSRPAALLHLGAPRGTAPSFCASDLSCHSIPFITSHWCTSCLVRDEQWE